MRPCWPQRETEQMTQPIVITGVGVLISNGTGREAFWNALERGQSGVRRIENLDVSDLPCQIAGQLRDFNPEDYMRRSVVRNWQRYVHQAVAASKLAVEDSELGSAGYDSERVAVSVGTSVGNPDELYVGQFDAYQSGGYKKVSRFTSSAFSGHSATAHVTIDLGLKGPAITIASGCATGLDVLTWGATQIRQGKADAAVVGASESPLFRMGMAAACSLGILSKRNDEPEKAMRPFDRHRDGIVLSEGAITLILERFDRAKARGARILGELAGSGAAADAGSALVLDPEGKALARAIGAALKDAGVQPHEVDHIQAHGVSLEMYDRTETNAIKRALGDHAYRVPISAVKSMTGQPYAVGGVLGVASALLALNRGVVPPTINLETADPECDLDYVPLVARKNDVRTALVLGMSFGGTYAASVVRKVA